MTEADINIPAPAARRRPLRNAPIRSRTALPVRRPSNSIVIRLFILTLVTPVIFYVGEVRLSPYRLILIATFIPLVVAWASGRAGRPQSPDFLILLCTLWSLVSLFVNHEPSMALQTGGILLLETFGCYLLARCLIRDRSSFEVMVRMLFLIVLLLLPFIIAEAITGRRILLDLFGNPVMLPEGRLPDMGVRRWGLVRAQGPFEHPILLGVFCSSVFGFVSYVKAKKDGNFSIVVRQGLIALAVGCSLSAGAFVSLVSQLGLMIWGRLTRGIKGRWQVLGLLVAYGYVALSSLSNQTVFEHFVNSFTFDLESSYYRILIWRFGSQEVVRHPFFGIGFHDWIRPDWMVSSSVDNFWLLTAMRHGLPAVTFLVAGICIIMIKLGRIQNLRDDVKACRNGLLISLSGIIISLCTVDLWNASYCLFFFLLGSGSWIPGEAVPQFAPAGRTRVERSAPMDIRG